MTASAQGQVALRYTERVYYIYYTTSYVSHIMQEYYMPPWPASTVYQIKMHTVNALDSTNTVD